MAGGCHNIYFVWLNNSINIPIWPYDITATLYSTIFFKTLTVSVLILGLLDYVEIYILISARMWLHRWIWLM